MAERKREKFRTFYGDPGETFGWSIGKDTKLLGGGQEPMWQMADELWYAMRNPDEPNALLNGSECLRIGVDPSENTGPIRRVVLEDFRIYPNKCRELAWNPVRTARIIGAITFMCRELGVELVLQPASIKDAAKRAGAEELYVRPLHENRHQNDSAQHFVFFTHTELNGARLVVPNQGVQKREDTGAVR